MTLIPSIDLAIRVFSVLGQSLILTARLSGCEISQLIRTLASRFACASEVTSYYEAIARKGGLMDEIKSIWKRGEIYPKCDHNLVLSSIRKALHQMHLKQLRTVRRIAAKLSEHLQQPINRHTRWCSLDGHKHHPAAVASIQMAINSTRLRGGICEMLIINDRSGSG